MLIMLINIYLSLFSRRVVPENMHTLPPPSLTEGSFALDPTALDSPSQGVHVKPPTLHATSWNSCNFSAWLGTLWKEYLCQECFCTIL